MSADPIAPNGLRGVLAGPELRELPKLLQPGEETLALVQGWYRGRPGMLVATSARLLFLDKGWLFGLHFEQFEYDRLTAVQYDGGLVWATIAILGAGGEARIERAPGDGARQLCERVQPLLGHAAAPQVVAAPPAPADGFAVAPPQSLPSFADVGGMDGLKQEAKQTLGLLLAFPDRTEEYRIDWNGLLLHGAPGSGKTHFGRALAGEFALGLVEVGAAAVGTDARKLSDAFATAAAAAPCVLFVDDLAELARRAPLVDPLVSLLEQARAIHGLVVVGATSDLDALGDELVRPGRFDRRLQIGLPDAVARRAILAVALAGRPADPQLDLDAVAARCDGLTAASLLQAVDAAALAALQASAPVSTVHLLGALNGLGGAERPTVDGWSWDRLVLPEQTKSELQALQALIEDPDRARQFGVEPPTGALLVGPPGTGKTTVARVLAAQARCSFFPVSAADVTSKWAGESEQSVKRLFERARAAAPAIVFLDEADALGAERGESDDAGYDRQLNQFLQEMDGIGGDRGVFVLAATNRPDRLDPALTRGGRLSRTIEIPLPDEQGRRAMLAEMTKPMPLAGVDLDALAARSDGFSGADLHALCQQAAVAAIVRGSDADTPQVLPADFETALADLRRKEPAPA
ncbi:MAG TPA: AAA family ATPase [Gaiellaceae bacterium]|nr:AAA family ATPase [Gaiellaceae bacterium]